MMNYKPGDIVDVPFPFIDRPVQKIRPALVLSHYSGESQNNSLILSMITSAKRSRWDTDIKMIEWNKSGLRAPSVIRWKIFTLDSALILNKRGHITETDKAAASKGFQDLFSSYLN